VDRVLILSYLARAQGLASAIEQPLVSDHVPDTTRELAREIRILIEQALEELAPVGVEQT
jgi:hypothetical protein